MQVEAIYDHGQITFDHPVRLAKERFPVILEIPDTVLIPIAEATARVTNEHPADSDGKLLLEEIRQILGPLSKMRAAVSSAEDKSALSEALAEKYGQ
jgi:hypothetical protein